MADRAQTRHETKQQPDDLRSRVILIAGVLAIAVLVLLLKRPAFRLGLDLQGGSRYVFRLQPDEDALAEQETPDSLYFETLAIVRERIDPNGTLEPVLRLEGPNKDRLIVEIPGISDAEGDDAGSATLDAVVDGAIGVGAKIPVSGLEGSFPPEGGVLLIGEEQIAYTFFSGTAFTLSERGVKGTEITDHAAGDTVELLSTNSILNRIQNLAKLSFEIVVEGGADSATILSEVGTSIAAEREKLNTWLEANPTAVNLRGFNSLSAEQGGPHASLRWIPDRLTKAEREVQVAPRSLAQRAMPLLRFREHPSYAEEDWAFTGDRLAATFATSDGLGMPAVGFELRSEWASTFGKFTETFVDNQMAIVLDEEIVSAPNLNSRIDQNGIIQGDFTVEEVKEQVATLRAGSLRLRPVLEHEEAVGPTLGAGYVRRGWISGLLGIGLVMVFMAAYYKRLGLFAALSLAANIFLLMAGLALMDATLTLPGIAGIVLTVGMAVDANILIFDRVREEMDNGRNIKQAAKNGFDKAFVTIIDANLTTLLTALVLYNVGTGPVKGFAVTLAIGILTSLFAALVITRSLVQYSLTKGAKELTMGRWLVNANYDWIGKGRTAVIGSLVAIAVGLGLFTLLPRTDKWGIDFLGGVELVVRTEEGQAAQTMRDRVGALDGDIAGADVTPILATGTGGGNYTDFRLTFKTASSDEAEGDLGGVFKEQLRRELGDLLQAGPIEISDGENARLYFEEAHPATEIAAAIEGLGLTEVSVTEDPNRSRAYDITGTRPVGLTDGQLASGIQTAFRGVTDTNGRKFALANPIPSSTSVSAQVVDKLQDKAILALIVSMFAIVLYIRARFAEYAYGFAAVVAVAHDVLITLGAIALMQTLGLLQLELSLAMIAAFLTIIGYSLNDTIVIFDRVRENRPRMEKPLSEILNISINQTMSRTVLTSITTVMVVVILFVANAGTGNTLEGFAFAMLIGLIAGTYSTIFIACPALLFFERRHREKMDRLRANAVAPKPKSEPSNATASA